MTAKEAIADLEKLKEILINFQTLMGVEKVEAPSLDKAIEALRREAEVEESTAWVKEALESGYFDEKPINAVNPEEFDTETDKAISQSDVIDAISREEALLCLTGQFAPEEEVGKYVSIFSKRIKALPPVQPARKGHWIEYDVQGHPACKCSTCDLDIDYKKRHRYRFCPYCGAEMED